MSESALLNFQLWSGPAYNQLHRIAKGGIQKPSHRLAELHGDFFRGKREDGSERDDSKEIQSENNRGVPAHCTSNYTQWHEYQEDIDIVAIQGNFSSLRNVGRNRHKLVITLHARCMILRHQKLEDRLQTALLAPGRVCAILPSRHQSRRLGGGSIWCHDSGVYVWRDTGRAWELVAGLCTLDLFSKLGTSYISFQPRGKTLAQPPR
jgi:hypothetical protein